MSSEKNCCTVNTFGVESARKTIELRIEEFDTIAQYLINLESMNRLEVVIISDKFIECNVVERHRMIYQILGDICTQIHAISVRGLTSKENVEKIANSI
jgi:stress-induced morphogen